MPAELLKFSPRRDPSRARPALDYNSTAVSQRDQAGVLDLPERRYRRSESPFQKGDRCGPYEIRRMIARGGFGDVYEAVHRVLGRPAAIKVLQHQHADQRDLAQRLEREARVLAEIKNPHMVSVYDAGEHEGRIWMAMELLDGKTLRDHLLPGSPLTVPRALNHAACIADGVAAAHRLRILHRDLKPENVFITKEGHTVVLDLGTAKVLGEVRGRPSQRVLGTVAYMSPEQLLGAADGRSIDQRSDVYALAIILYEMLCGSHPFSLSRHALSMPSSAELARLQIHVMPPGLREVAPWVPEAVAELVRRGLDKNPELRPTSMRDFEHEIRALARDVVEQHGSSGPPLSTPRKALCSGRPTERIAPLAHVQVSTRTRQIPPKTELASRTLLEPATLRKILFLAPVLGALFGLATVHWVRTRSRAPVAEVASKSAPAPEATAPDALPAAQAETPRSTARRQATEQAPPAAQSSPAHNSPRVAAELHRPTPQDRARTPEPRADRSDDVFSPPFPNRYDSAPSPSTEQPKPSRREVWLE
jgi:serine/threonine protein kinase